MELLVPRCREGCPKGPGQARTGIVMYRAYKSSQYLSGVSGELCRAIAALLGLYMIIVHPQW